MITSYNQVCTEIISNHILDHVLRTSLVDAIWESGFSQSRDIIIRVRESIKYVELLR